MNVVLDPTSTGIPTEAVLEVALEEGVDVVSFSFGSGAEFVARGHAHSGCAMQTVGSVAGATEAVEANADVVAAQVQEAGGHVESDVSPRPLVPRVADAIDDRPVVAAGGTVDR